MISLHDDCESEKEMATQDLASELELTDQQPRVGERACKRCDPMPTITPGEPNV